MLTILLDTAELREAVPSTGDREQSQTSVYPHTAQLTSGRLLGLPSTALGVRVQVHLRQPHVLFPVSGRLQHRCLWPLHREALPSEASGYHLHLQSSGHPQCWTSAAPPEPYQRLEEPSRPPAYWAQQARCPTCKMCPGLCMSKVHDKMQLI